MNLQGSRPTVSRTRTPRRGLGPPWPPRRGVRLPRRLPLDALPDHPAVVETLDTDSHLWRDPDDRTREAVDSLLALPAPDSLRTAEGPLFAPLQFRGPRRRGWSVGRVLFPGALRRSVRRPSISDRRCRRPPAVHPRTRAGSPRTCAVRPCFGRGLPSRPGRPGRWWSLAPPFHPYRSPRTAAVCSLWHCPADHSGWVLPTALPCGARTFLGTWSYQLIPARYRGRPTNP